MPSSVFVHLFSLNETTTCTIDICKCCHIYLWEHQLGKEQIIKIANDKGIDIPNIPNRKRLIENLSIRIMLYQLLGENAHIYHASSGKPELKYTNTLNISISHTNNAYALSLYNKSHGIDIEHISERALNLRNRFLSPIEQTFRPLRNTNDMCANFVALWCAKEAAFKTFSSQEIVIITQIKLTQGYKGRLYASSTQTDATKGHISFFEMRNLIIAFCETNQEITSIHARS